MRIVVHMKLAVLFGRLAAVLLCVATAAGAAARELRHPGPGVPAFTVQVPDNWTHQVTDDNLIALSQDKTMSIVVAFWTHTGSPEEAARMMLEGGGATAPTGKMSASLSGLPGFSFDSTSKSSKGQPLQVKLMIVRVSSRVYGSVLKFELASNSPEQRQLADTVMQSVRIVGTPAPTGGRE
jgi:hypothetical protein